MDTTEMSFKDVLDEIFFPSDGKKKKKKRDKHAAETGYAPSGADEDSLASLRDMPACSAYAGSDYPDLIAVGAFPLEIDENAAFARLGSLLAAAGGGSSAPPVLARETLDEKRLALLTFRADSYALFSMIEPGESPVKAGKKGVPAEVQEPRPKILVKKTMLAVIDAMLSSGGDVPDAGTGGSITGSSDSGLSWTIDHPAEFVVSRLFFPPRLAVSAYRFAIVPSTLLSAVPRASNVRRVGFMASWTFSGQPLSALYHVDLPPTAGERENALAKAIVAGAFKDALAFWASWKRPVEKPALAAAPASSPKGTVCLAAHIQGEGLSFPFLVEFPSAYIPFIAKMCQSAPLEASAPSRLFELVRANDALFGVLRGSYRKAFIAAGSVGSPVPTASVYAILSLVDDADKSIIIQNFLVPRYELKNVPLFFYYHAPQQKPDGETAYRLKPAFPIARGDIERFLSGSLRDDWNYALSKGCMHRITTQEDFAELNRQAVETLARDVASGKILVSGKAARILREDVLAPLEAVARKEFDDNGWFQERNAPLGNLPAKSVTDMLGKLDNHALAMACLGDEYLYGILSKGMSRSRQSDIRAEMDLTKKRLERGDLSVRPLLEARKLFVEVSQPFVDLAGEGGVL